jgi:short-subunit dehydrogenase
MVTNIRDSVHEPRYALVTGAAAGIGRAVAADLARQGYRLVLADINHDALLEFRCKLQEYGNSADIHTVNLCDAEQLEQFCEAIERREDGLVLAFVNAGVVTPGLVTDLSRERLLRDVDLNLRAAMCVNHACAKRMKAQGYGHIINTASMAALVSLPGSAAYSASKFGLRGFLIALKAELKPHGIAVSMLLPSAIDTAMLRFEANNDGSALNFLSTPSSVSDVVAVFNKAQKGKKLEYCIPASGSFLGYIVCVFPGLLERLYPLLSKIGERGRKRFLNRQTR